jgi:nicotinate phosphoribosyltransferase
MSDPGLENPARSALFTDLYELTMAAAYHAEGMAALAVFELFFRELPDNRNYVVAAGLEDVLDYLEHWRFTEEDITYLAAQMPMPAGFADALRRLRFAGDVHAVPEGTVVFENEPLVQVIAPIIQGQIVETSVLNQIHFQSVIATKAARVISAAAGRQVVDFGSRRAHGTDAALKVARASYLAGAAGTSNVLAGKRYGIRIFGTMAHSYIQAHDDEAEAFEAFARLNPRTTLLVDTADTLAAVRKIVERRRKLGDKFDIGAIRLDSGDLGQLAKESRALLDEAGMRDVRIFASGGLDEYDIAALIDGGAPIDGFGVGTKLAISADAPSLDMAYKLVEYAGEPRTKLSAGKVICPGRKQVFRVCAGECMERDVIGRYDEDVPGRPLLEPVMTGGKRLPAARVPLEAARSHCQAQVALLPEPLRALKRAEEAYLVSFSDALKRDLARVTQSPRPEQ